MRELLQRRWRGSHDWLFRNSDYKGNAGTMGFLLGFLSLFLALWTSDNLAAQLACYLRLDSFTQCISLNPRPPSCSQRHCSATLWPSARRTLLCSVMQGMAGSRIIAAGGPTRRVAAPPSPKHLCRFPPLVALIIASCRFNLITPPPLASFVDSSPALESGVGM